LIHDLKHESHLDLELIFETFFDVEHISLRMIFMMKSRVD